LSSASSEKNGKNRKYWQNTSRIIWYNGLVHSSVIDLKIKAVLFDMGNTLIEYDYDAPEEVFRSILLSLGIPKTLDDVREAFLSAKDDAANIGLLSSFGRMECEEYWNLWDSLVLKHLGIAEHMELGEIVQSRWFDFMGCTFYPEAREVLSELRRRGLKVGLISNGYEEEIAFAVEKTGLEKTTFDIIVGVDTTKKAKPDSDVFRYAASKLNVKLYETMFVGDSVYLDYEGAEKAGMRALLIDRTGKNHTDLRTIKNLRELFTQIDLHKS
jgi:FMN phosphatase YigB (HAD superfamily)